MGVFDAIGNAATTVYATERGIQAAKEQQAREQAWASSEALANRVYQTSEREATQDWNYQMWNETNEYNSASSQYQRLIDAGMNPVTAMSALSGANQTASSLVTSPQSGSMASSPGSVASTIGELIGNSANNFWTNELARQQVRGQEIQNQFAPSISERQIKKLDVEVDDLVASKELKKEQATQIKELLPALKDKTETEVKELKTHIDKMLEETALIKQQSKTEEAKQRNLEQSSNLMGAQTEYTKSENLIAKEEALKLKWENSLRSDFGIDPHSDIGNNIMSLILTGDPDEFFNRFFDLSGKFFEKIGINTGDPGERRWLEKMFKPFFGLGDLFNGNF